MNVSNVQKIVLGVVVLAVLAVAGFFGWHEWQASAVRARVEGWRASANEDASNVPKVIAELRAELRVNPAATAARALLGELLAKSGKPSDAAIELREAARLAPGDVAIHRHLADVCLQLDLVDEAIRWLDEAIGRAEGTEKAEAQLDLARVYQERYRGSAKEEDFRSARNLFQEARRDRVTEPAAMHGYATLWMEKGPNRDLEKALTTLKELLQKHPDYPEAPRIEELVKYFSSAEGRGG